MKPEGHEPTREDQRFRSDMNPKEMHDQIEQERTYGIECDYTHYSRDEQVGRRSGFSRRFSRAALDPFVANSSLIRGIGTDESGHAVMKMGDI